MTNNFYFKLAKTNIKNNSKAYIPYFITCVFTIAMFYIIHAISRNPGLDSISGSASLKEILRVGSWIIAIFSAIFLFYTNSFLLKQRKKELGLYNVLGLGKNHIRHMLFVETLILYFLSLVSGILLGMVLNKLMYAFLLKLLNFPIPLGFTIAPLSIAYTFILFTLIFASIYINNMLHITITKPVELLNGDKTGEKEPKTNWIVALIGFIALASGYYIALSTESALEAIATFLPAVILVMIGTYGLFSAGSIVLLKRLRQNKPFYYKTENFITLSGLIYRMKQNAVGLANICILSTAVLITLSSTASLYIGMEDVLDTRFPREIVTRTSIKTRSDIELVDNIIAEEIEKSDLQPTNLVNYQNMPLFLSGSDGNYGIMESDSFSINNTVFLEILAVDEYNRLEGSSISLADNEVVLISTDKDYGKATITIDGKTFNVIEEKDQIFGANIKIDINKSYIMIVSDINTFTTQLFDLAKSTEASTLQASSESDLIVKEEGLVLYNYSFDTLGSTEDAVIELSNNIKQSLDNSPIREQVTIVENQPAHRESFYSLYGGLFFLGIFVGALFLMATVLIIYYKQISEGYDDKERFKIMQNVGLSQAEVKATIKNQILMVFFLPLVFAIIHVGVAFPILIKVLRVFNLYNWQLYLGTTIITAIVFTIIYGLVYNLTAKSYYNIVGHQSNKASGHAEQYTLQESQ